jgi:hypothetical protein
VVLCLPFVVKPSYAQGVQATIPVLSKQVKLDGMWPSADEWTDSVEITPQPPGGFFRLKHDQSFLYVLFDCVSAKALVNYDVAWVYIDTLKNGGGYPQTDDYAFTFQWSGPTQSYIQVLKGTGTIWATSSLAPFSANSSLNAINDPYSSAEHVIYEFQIPLSIIPQSSASIGVRLSMQDGTTGTWYIWPSLDSSRSVPSQWGTMALGASPTPEFSTILPTLALGLIFPLYLLRRSRKQARSGNSAEDA